MSAAPSRAELPNRRPAATVSWREAIGGTEHDISASFGRDAHGRITEVFCSGHKEGSHLRAEVTDGCILLSYCLQYGAGIVGLAQALGEDREEGRRHGAPASIASAIARRGAMLERDAKTWLCPRRDELCSKFRGHLMCDCELKGAVK